MQAFLQQVAAYIKSNYNDFSDVCVVMPNRRAGLYLKKYLAEGIEKPVFAPDIFSIEDFFVKVLGIQLIDPVGLLFTFYEVHQKVEGSKAQAFDDFIRWARTLLSDFNEIDVHLVDAKQLFTYLNEVKAIEKWNPDGQQLTEVEKEYLAFYRSLYSYYQLLREKLEKTNTAYQGMVWRKLAEKPELLTDLPWKHIVFAGFNALTSSEEVIINSLCRAGKAEVLWDADGYYVEDKSQEAGHFLRKHIQKSKKDKFNWIGKYYEDSVKEINITGVPKNVAQAIHAASIIKKWSDENEGPSQSPHGGAKPNLENTALVLADEDLLLPVLSALPDDMGDFNVTMGFPIKQTNLYQMLVQVIRLYENAERFGKLEEDHVRGFYYFDLIKLFQQPYFSYICDTSDWVHDIKISNRVFYSPAHTVQMLEKYDFPAAGVLKKIFREISLDPKALIALLVDLLAYFRDQMIELKKTDASVVDTELEYLYNFSKIFMRLKGLFETHNFVTSIKSFREIFNAIAMISRVPFYGEPLKGMQLMGVLETRNLDFDKVIMLSVNEGTLPASGIGNSFIPFDIQKQFGLPTHQEKNAVFAYHFYRLLQRATDVHLIYNTEATDLGGGEKSRFIQQLLQEMPGYNPRIKFEESIESLPVLQVKATIPLVVEKTDNVFQKLLAKAKKGLSPTSLNRYRRCGLQFYLQDIVHLEENEEVEETMEARTIGMIVHETLEKLFEPYKDQQLNNSKLATIVKILDAELSASFERQYAMGEIRFGKNRLIYEVIRNFLKSYLNFEKEFLSGLEANGSTLTILKLEEELSTNIKLSGSDTEIRLRGNVDRMDELDGTVRIIDYKTGIVTPAELTLIDWEHFKDGKKLDKAFQVLMYAWLVWQSSGEKNPQYESGVISMRKLSEGFIKFGVRTGRNQRDTEVNHEVLEQFEQYLRQTLDGLFDQGIPFEQTKDIEVCERCNFNTLCSRV